MIKKLLSLVLAIGILGIGNLHAQQIPGNPSGLSRTAGTFYASAYSTWHSTILSGNTTTGAVSIVVSPPTSMQDGTNLPLQIAWSSPYLSAPFVADANAETATSMTAISYSSCPAGNLGIGGSPLCATLSGNFANTHGQGALVYDGTFGLTSAAAAAYAAGGGTVVVDAAWTALGGTSAMINSLAALAYNITIMDVRNGTPRYWNPTPTGLALAAPTLPAINIAGQAACDTTHQMCSDATVAGSASWGGTVFAAWTYMDCFGNEGPPSATTSWTSVASKAIDLGIPAASPGACGAVPYLSLSGGTYAQAFRIAPTSTVCTLSTLTPIPSCAVTNATYGATGSTFGAAGLFTTGGAQITVYPVNTYQHFPQLASTVQTTASYTPMTNSSVSYAYAPSNRVGTCGITPWNQTQNIAAGGISASSTAAIPMSFGSWSVPAGCFNYKGAEFRVSGKFTFTEGGTSAATYNLLVGWDAQLTNTTTIPLELCTIANTHTPAAAAQNGYFSCTVKILTTGATGTALVNGTGDFSIATGQALLIGFANDTAVAASGSINLLVPARITVNLTDSGNTVTGAQGLDLSLEVLN